MTQILQRLNDPNVFILIALIVLAQLLGFSLKARRQAREERARRQASLN